MPSDNLCVFESLDGQITPAVQQAIALAVFWFASVLGGGCPSGSCPLFDGRKFTCFWCDQYGQ